MQHIQKLMDSLHCEKCKRNFSLETLKLMGMNHLPLMCPICKSPLKLNREESEKC